MFGYRRVNVRVELKLLRNKRYAHTDEGIGRYAGSFMTPKGRVSFVTLPKVDYEVLHRVITFRASGGYLRNEAAQISAQLEAYGYLPATEA